MKKPEARRFAFLLAAFLLSVLIIPAVSYGVGASIERGVTRYLATEGEVPVAGDCPGWSWHWTATPNNPCEMLAYAHGLKQASLWFVAFGVATPFLILLLGYLLSKRALAMGLGFPILVHLGGVIAVGAILVPVGFIFAAVFLSIRHFLGFDMSFMRIAPYFVFLAGGICFRLIRRIFALGEWQEQSMRVLPLNEDEESDVWKLVHEVAERIKVYPPHYVLLSEKPGFFVTRSRINTLNKGEKLYGWKLGLSAPARRLLSEGEFRAVVGHELAHMRPGMSPYILNLSLPWVQFRQLARHGEGIFPGMLILALVPGLATLEFVFMGLSSLACASRPRFESKADKTALAVARPDDLVSALLKSAIFNLVSICIHTEGGNEVLQEAQRRFEDNRSLGLAACAVGFARWIDRDKMRAEIDRLDESDVLRFHPAIAERAAALGVDYGAAILKVVDELRDWSSPPEDELSGIERALMAAEHEPDAPEGTVVSPRDRVMEQD